MSSDLSSPVLFFFLLLPVFTMSWGSWIVFKGAIQHPYAFRNVQESLWGDLTDPVFSSDEYLHIKFLLGLGFARDNGGNCLMHQAPCCYCIVHCNYPVFMYWDRKRAQTLQFLSITKIRRDFVTSCASYLLYYEYDMRALTWHSSSPNQLCQ